MAKYSSIFKRTEKKYLINEKQRQLLMDAVSERLECDKFGKSTISNIYFDTDNYRLIRASIEKPSLYKEKLRLRCYGNVESNTNCFVELKKKYKGTVYKRRINMPYAEAMDWLCGKKPCPKQNQITHEIDYFLKFYSSLKPAIALYYDRSAYFYKEDKSLRITFDSNIRFSNESTDLRSCGECTQILGEGEYIMEIKTPGSMPLWLTHELSRLEIYPTSYSKYGTAYRMYIANTIRR